MTMLTISQLARRSGMAASTLRYYEKVGVIPPATRSDSGYRLYDEKALARLAFVQRAKALGVDLGDLADLVRLWDGAECAPVQDRLRGLVHEQRAATRGRLEELSQLAADLDAVSATIGDAACGPDCPCVQPIASAPVELPLPPERLIGAACTLSSGEVRERLAEWRRLRDRAASVEERPDGARLTFANEPVAPIGDLIERESECCSFYTFDLRIDGAVRQLDIRAGAGGEPAVRALLGLEH